MKIYSLPSHLPAPTIDYVNYDRDIVAAREKVHQLRLKDFLISFGFKGKHTGKIFETPWANGAAIYMLADGAPSCLVHLPYGDAWECPNTQFLPKKEILARIAHQSKLIRMFGIC